MRKIEIVLGLSALISAILNLFDYPMSTQLLLVSIGNLSIFYMYFSIPLFNKIPFREMFSRSSYTGISKLRIIGSLALGLSFSASLIGLLFKLMIWPNADLELVIGLAGILIACAAAIWKYQQNNESFYLDIFKRVAIFFVLVVFGLALPKYAILEFKFVDYPYYVKAFIERSESPNNPALAEKVEKERLRMLEEMSVKQNSPD